MPVEVAEGEIRARIVESSEFIDGSLCTKYLSEEQGIYTVIGKLKSKPISMSIQSYRFKKDKG